MKKTLSILLLVGLGLFIITFSIESAVSIELSDALYTLVGLNWVVSGTWLSILNLKN